jgi:hypothetical protein
MSGGYAPANGARGAPVHRVVNADITVGVSIFLGILYLPRMNVNAFIIDSNLFWVSNIYFMSLSFNYLG